MDNREDAELWAHELKEELIGMIAQLRGDVEVQDLDGHLVILLDSELVDRWVNMDMTLQFVKATGIDPAGVFDGDEWVGDYALSRHGTTCADYTLAKCAEYEPRVLKNSHQP